MQDNKELTKKIAYRIAIARFGKKNADAIQFGGHLGWYECLLFAEIAVQEIKKCEIAKGVLK